MTAASSLHAPAGSEDDSTALPSPAALRAAHPLTPRAASLVERARREIRDALHGRDSRLVVVVGPCSIHDADAAREYAGRLSRLASEVGDALIVVMRTYFEKPRTTVGWKGLLHDPHLDGSCDLHAGLALGRRILVDVHALGLPCATEILDPIARHYFADLLAWVCIGARTTESQIHREMASGLPLPVGFKNPTSGDIARARDAVVAARSPHRHLGVLDDGRLHRITTPGNPDAHVVLRGGDRGPNYAPEHVSRAATLTAPLGLARPVLIDCSHDNSAKDHRRQSEVLHSVLDQLEAHASPILGVMLESQLEEGRQDLRAGSRPSSS